MMGSPLIPLDNPYDSVAVYLQENDLSSMKNEETNNLEDTHIENNAADESSTTDDEEESEQDIFTLPIRKKRKIRLSSDSINEYVMSKKRKMDEKNQLEIQLLKTKNQIALVQLKTAKMELKIKQAILRKEEQGEK